MLAVRAERSTERKEADWSESLYISFTRPVRLPGRPDAKSASGYQAVYQAMVLVLTGLMAYSFLKARRERLSEAPEPHDLPTQDHAAALPRPGAAPRRASA